MKDKTQLRVAWAAYFAIGTGLLAPWNALLTGIDYFAAVFPGKPMDRLFTIMYLPACLSMLLLLLRFKTPLLTPRVRIVNSFMGFSLIMLIIPVLDFFNLGPAPPAPGEATSPIFPAVLCVTVVIGALDGLCQGAVFADAAALPSQFTQAVVSGTACSGFLVSLLRISSKALWAEEQKALDFQGLRASTELYLLAAALLCLGCGAAYGLLLPKLPALQQLRRDETPVHASAGPLFSKSGPSVANMQIGPVQELHPLHQRTSQHPESAEEHGQIRATGNQSATADEEGGHSEQVSPLLTFQASRSCEVELHRPEHKDNITLFKSCWQRLWPLCTGLLSTYIITLSIFPGFLAEDVENKALGDWYPILLISAYNTSDLIGKLLPASSNSWKKKAGDESSRSRLQLQRVAFTWLAASVARVLFIPAFICAAFLHTPPLIMGLLTVALGVSNGFVTAGLMLGGPELLDPGMEEAGEGILVISLITGLLIGASAGFLWLLC